MWLFSDPRVSFDKPITDFLSSFLGINPIITETGRHADALEECFGLLDGLLYQILLWDARQAEYALAILKDLLPFLFFPIAHQGRINKR